MIDPPPAIVVRKVRGMGRGVFVGRPFRRGEVIEVCPVLPLPPGTTEDRLPGGLDRYVFRWGRKEDGLAVVLGLGSLYNHSLAPNAVFAPRVARAEMVFRAGRDIAAGEQVVIDYGWPADDYAGFR